MQVYNPATKQTTDVPDKAYPTWALHGWVPVDQAPVEDEDTDEVTAEDTGRGRHPAAKANKDT